MNSSASIIECCYTVHIQDGNTPLHLACTFELSCLVEAIFTHTATHEAIDLKNKVDVTRKLYSCLLIHLLIVALYLCYSYIALVHVELCKV